MVEKVTTSFHYRLGCQYDTLDGNIVTVVHIDGPKGSSHQQFYHIFCSDDVVREDVDIPFRHGWVSNWDKFHEPGNLAIGSPLRHYDLTRHMVEVVENEEKMWLFMDALVSKFGIEAAALAEEISREVDFR